MMSKTLLVWMMVGGLVVTAALSGCDSAESASGSGTKRAVASAGDALPAELFLSEQPDGAKGVAAVKADPTAGEVVVRGRIGGRVEPFVKGRAIFTLADISLPTCTEKHGDGCPTPWDYCCEPRDAVLVNSTTIQVVGADGRPLKADIKSQHGLEPLAEVVVVGDPLTNDDGTLMAVNARGIYVVGK